MEIKNITEKKNLVFDRKEIIAMVSSESAPSNKDILTLLAKKLSVPEDAIKINGIYGRFGIREFEVKANIYKTKEEKNKIERKTKKDIENEKKEIESIKATKKAAEEEKKKTEEAAKKAEEEKKKAKEEKPEQEKGE